MPVPFILGGAALLTAVAGLKKGIDGISDSREADEINEEAEVILTSAKNKSDVAREKTSLELQELGREKIIATAENLKDFVDIFSKIKNVDLGDINIVDDRNSLVENNQINLSEMREVALKATDLLGSGISGLGAGALIGWGTYGGVMALGSASTGAAISGLSGVAATNATLAWLGGGSLAVGGGGMALGSMVLGGVIAGPALLVMGGIFGAKAQEKLNNAYSNLSIARKTASDIDRAVAMLKHIELTVKQVREMLQLLRNYSKVTNEEMGRIISIKDDWKNFNDDEKSLVGAALKFVQILKKIIDTPVLTENGEITREVKELLS